MPLTRNHRIAAALLAALACAPAVLVPPPAAGRGAPERAPVMQFAVLPEPARPRRRGYARVRTIRLGVLRRLREQRSVYGPLGRARAPRPPMRASHARGPPRRAGC